MEVLILLILTVLTVVYIVRQFKNKFSGEKRKDILMLQVSIWILLLLGFILNINILLIPALILIIMLAFLSSRVKFFFSKK